MTDKKKTILIDMDGVLVDLLPTWLREYNEASGGKVLPHHISDYKMSACDDHKILFGALDLVDFAELPALPNAINSMKRLGEHFEVIIVSYAVTPKIIGGKLRWVRKNLPWFNTDNIIFTKRKDLIRGDVLYEDNYEELMRRPKDERYLYPASYNGGVVDDVQFEGDWLSFTHHMIHEFGGRL